MDDTLRLLEVVRRELGADDARVEIGGRDPGDDVVWCAVEGRRLVVVFDDAPEQSLAELRERLETLVRAFPTTLEPREKPRRVIEPQRALDDALDILAQQSTATHALVIDDSSPVIWGSSDLHRGPEDIVDAKLAAEALTLASAAGMDLAAHLAGVVKDPLPEELQRLIRQMHVASEHQPRDIARWRDVLRVSAALVTLRDSIAREPTATRFALHDPDLAMLARGFGNIYWMLLVFDRAGFSELHAEAAMIHASPWIEKLVSALPPVDPSGGGGRVTTLRRLRPV